MGIGDRKDPYLGYNFSVQVGGEEVAAFSEVTGLEAEIEIQEYREGGVNEYTHKLAGPVRYTSNLVLKRGISDSRGLWSWYCDVMRGEIQRKSISIVLMNSASEQKVKWDFQNAYPVKWTGVNLRASASEVAIESIELVHDGLMPSSMR
jgi:phage tail-like protein